MPFPAKSVLTILPENPIPYPLPARPRPPPPPDPNTSGRSKHSFQRSPSECRLRRSRVVPPPHKPARSIAGSRHPPPGSLFAFIAKLSSEAPFLEMTQAELYKHLQLIAYPRRFGFVRSIPQFPSLFLRSQHRLLSRCRRADCGTIKSPMASIGFEWLRLSTRHPPPSRKSSPAPCSTRSLREAESTARSSRHCDVCASIGHCEIAMLPS